MCNLCVSSNPTELSLLSLLQILPDPADFLDLCNINLQLHYSRSVFYRRGGMQLWQLPPTERWTSSCRWFRCILGQRTSAASSTAGRLPRPGELSGSEGRKPWAEGHNSASLEDLQALICLNPAAVRPPSLKCLCGVTPIRCCFLWETDACWNTHSVVIVKAPPAVVSHNAVDPNECKWSDLSF